MTANKARPILLPTKCRCSAHPHPHPRFAGDSDWGSIPTPIPDFNLKLPGIGDIPIPGSHRARALRRRAAKHVSLYGNFKLNLSS
jgi:hypothetical protein